MRSTVHACSRATSADVHERRERKAEPDLADVGEALHGEAGGVEQVGGIEVATALADDRVDELRLGGGTRLELLPAALTRLRETARRRDSSRRS